MSHNTLPPQPHDNNCVGGDSSARQPSSSTALRWQSAAPLQSLSGLKDILRAFHSAHTERKWLHEPHPSGEEAAEANGHHGWDGSGCLSVLHALAGVADAG